MHSRNGRSFEHAYWLQQEVAITGTPNSEIFNNPAEQQQERSASGAFSFAGEGDVGAVSLRIHIHIFFSCISGPLLLYSSSINKVMIAV